MYMCMIVHRRDNVHNIKECTYVQNTNILMQHGLIRGSHRKHLTSCITCFIELDDKPLFALLSQ